MIFRGNRSPKEKRFPAPRQAHALLVTSNGALLTDSNREDFARYFPALTAMTAGKIENNEKI